MAKREKITRALIWIRKSLRIIEKSESPDEFLDSIRPTVDAFGWERLLETTIEEVSSPAPSSVVEFGAAFTDTEKIRVILKASGRTSDTGVTHTVSLTKQNSARGAEVGMPLDRPTVIPAEIASMIGQGYLIAGQLIQFQSTKALVAGGIAAQFEWVDIPIGEYISPMP